MKIRKKKDTQTSEEIKNEREKQLQMLILKEPPIEEDKRTVEEQLKHMAVITYNNMLTLQRTDVDITMEHLKVMMEDITRSIYIMIVAKLEDFEYQRLKRENEEKGKEMRMYG